MMIFLISHQRVVELYIVKRSNFSSPKQSQKSVLQDILRFWSNSRNLDLSYKTNLEFGTIPEIYMCLTRQI